ncbi:hypothetical protein BJV77DRAFT_1021322 [Russula vinacea]|nr:hypothetical protein BJV77DRAFT_1021322 [Russula vinacea]
MGSVRLRKVFLLISQHCGAFTRTSTASSRVSVFDIALGEPVKQRNHLATETAIKERMLCRLYNIFVTYRPSIHPQTMDQVQILNTHRN